MKQIAVVPFSFKYLTDWHRPTCGRCWVCGSEGPRDIAWYEQEFLVYATLQDWTRVGLCSPACIRAAFEDDLASFFDWQPFEPIGDYCPDRDYSSGACLTCRRKDDGPYITLSTRFPWGGWDFCSAACVRRYYCHRRHDQAIDEWEMRQLISENDACAEYAFTPKTRQICNKRRK